MCIIHIISVYIVEIGILIRFVGIIYLEHVNVENHVNISTNHYSNNKT